jgi:hypothetical protein
VGAPATETVPTKDGEGFIRTALDCLRGLFRIICLGLITIKKNILKHRHHSERESIDNTNNFCIFSRVTIPVMLLHYIHFTNYDFFIHIK